ncbi:hypothetical protein P9112_006408 [Eukaryota sp. TZLM1-RC]
MKLLLFVTLLSFTAYASIEVLTSTNYDETISSDKYTFVKFYAPWCGHCKSMAPQWEQLADLAKSFNDQITIAEVNGDVSKDIMKKESIRGFPTLKLFKNGKVVADFKGQRTLEGFTDFISKHTSIKLTPTTTTHSPVRSHVADLTEFNFDKKVTGKCTFIKFYAPWCGHCKAIKEPWEKLGEVYAGESNVVIAEINCDEQHSLCEAHEVQGFPTIKIITPEGSEEVYANGRDVDSFVEFVNQNCGTLRKSDGSLPSTFGRDPDFDKLAIRFFTEDKEKIIQECWELLQKSTNEKKDIGRVYYRTMEKAADDHQYLMAQSARLARILKSGSVAPEKLTLLTARKNVVDAFMGFSK